MKILLTVLTVLAISGCSCIVDIGSVNKATKMCGEVGAKLVYIHMTYPNFVTVRCDNGQFLDMKNN